MTTKDVGSVYRVECKHFATDVLNKWRSTLPENQKRSKVVLVKLLGLIPGTRSYECEVVGASCTVKLSSKSLADKDASSSRQQAPQQSSDVDRDDSAGGEDSSGSDEEGRVDEDDQAAVDAQAAHEEIAGICAADWQRVAAFDDQRTKMHPNYDVHLQGRLRVPVPMTPCDLLLAFFPPKWS
jgi:hypothetical protein